MFAAIGRKSMYFAYLPGGRLDVDLHLLENFVGWVLKGNWPCYTQIVVRVIYVLSAHDHRMSVPFSFTDSKQWIKRKIIQFTAEI